MTGRLWTPLFILLATIIAVGGIIIWSRHSALAAVELSLGNTVPPEYCGEIYIMGDVASPGLYPVDKEDTLATLIQAAGGALGDVPQSEIKLYVSNGDDASPQKVDINRAEAWLLEALPGIGEERAQTIVDYRTENGPFRSVAELARVKGIGPETLAEIASLITVGD